MNKFWLLTPAEGVAIILFKSLGKATNLRGRELVNAAIKLTKMNDYFPNEESEIVTSEAGDGCPTCGGWEELDVFGTPCPDCSVWADKAPREPNRS